MQFLEHAIPQGKIKKLANYSNFLRYQKLIWLTKSNLHKIADFLGGRGEISQEKSRIFLGILESYLGR